MGDDILTMITLFKSCKKHIWVKMELYAKFGTDRSSRFTVMRPHTYMFSVQTNIQTLFINKGLLFKFWYKIEVV